MRYHLTLVLFAFIFRKAISFGSIFPPFRHNRHSHRIDRKSYPYDCPQPCPKSSILEAKVLYPYGYYPGRQTTLPSTLNTLMSCPNITALHLSISHDTGCIAGDGPWSFNFTPSSIGKQIHFPNLTELRVFGYDFDDMQLWHEDRRKAGYDLPFWWEYTIWDYLKVWDQYRVPSKKVYPPPPTKPEPLRMDYLARNLKEWENVMDWGKLKVLQVNDVGPGFLMHMARQGALPEIGELALAEDRSRNVGVYWLDEEWERREELWVEFVRNITSQPRTQISKDNWHLSPDSIENESEQHRGGLERLKLDGPISPQTFVKEVLPVHTSMLKELSFRQTSYNYSLGYENIEYLATVLASSASLHTVTFDISFNKTAKDWPYKQLQPLAQIKRVQHLTLHLKPYPDCRDRRGDLYDESTIIEPSPHKLEYCRRTGMTQSKRSTFTLNEDMAYDLFIFLRGQKHRSGYPELLDLRLWDEKGNTIFCNVLDKHRKRKREGKAWCTKDNGGVGGGMFGVQQEYWDEWNGGYEYEGWAGDDNDSAWDSEDPIYGKHRQDSEEAMEL